MQHSLPDNDVDGVAEEGQILLEAHPEIRGRFQPIAAALAEGTYQGQMVVVGMVDARQLRELPGRG